MTSEHDYCVLYSSGLSLRDVSKITNIPVSSLRTKLKEKGLLRKRLDALKMVGSKAKMGRPGEKRKPLSESARKKISDARLIYGEKHAKGVSLKPNGYLEYTRGEHKGRLVHVVLMESFIGRRILPNECVHHKNEKKDDNRLCNLQLMTREEHSRHHALEKLETRERDSKGKFK
jgi:hypothetical protein